MSRTRRTFLGAGLLLFVVGCGGGGAATPDAAFKEFQAAVKAKDGARAWALLSKDSQSKMDQQVSMMKDQFKKFEKLAPAEQKKAEEVVKGMIGMSLAELKSLDGKGLLDFSLKNAEKFAKGGGDPFAEVGSATLENVKVEGNTAKGKVKSGGKTEDIEFVKEGAAWKVKMPGMK